MKTIKNIKIKVKVLGRRFIQEQEQQEKQQRQQWQKIKRFIHLLMFYCIIFGSILFQVIRPTNNIYKLFDYISSTETTVATVTAKVEQQQQQQQPIVPLTRTGTTVEETATMRNQSDFETISILRKDPNFSSIYIKNQQYYQQQQQQQLLQYQPQIQERRIAFLHVGKTGGTTLRLKVLRYSCSFLANAKRRTECEDSFLQNDNSTTTSNTSEDGGGGRGGVVPESVLSNQTRVIYHWKHTFGPNSHYLLRSKSKTNNKNKNNNNNNKKKGATDVLISLREPVSRFQSWYYFQHPGLECIRVLTPFNNKHNNKNNKNTNSPNKNNNIKYKPYNHPKWCKEERLKQLRSDPGVVQFFYKCFPTLQDLNHALEDPISYYNTSSSPNTTFITTNNNDHNNNIMFRDPITGTILDEQQQRRRNQTECTHLLKEAFQFVGTNSTFGHLAAGYRYYSQLEQQHEQYQPESLSVSFLWNASHSINDDNDDDDNNNSNNDIMNNNSTTLRPLWAVRTEYLWHDVQTIDQLLGGTGDFGNHVGFKYTHENNTSHQKVQSPPFNGSTTTSTSNVDNNNYSNNNNNEDENNNNNNNNINNNIKDDGMTAVGTMHLCCALWPDIQAYIHFMERAINLSPNDRLETYQLTWEKCQVSSWVELHERCNDSEWNTIFSSEN